MSTKEGKDILESIEKARRGVHQFSNSQEFVDALRRISKNNRKRKSRNKRRSVSDHSCISEYLSKSPPLILPQKFIYGVSSKILYHVAHSYSLKKQSQVNATVSQKQVDLSISASGGGESDVMSTKSIPQRRKRRRKRKSACRISNSALENASSNSSKGTYGTVSDGTSIETETSTSKKIIVPSQGGLNSELVEQGGIIGNEVSNHNDGGTLKKHSKDKRSHESDTGSEMEIRTHEGRSVNEIESGHHKGQEVKSISGDFKVRRSQNFAAPTVASAGKRRSTGSIVRSNRSNKQGLSGKTSSGTVFNKSSSLSDKAQSKESMNMGSVLSKGSIHARPNQVDLSLDDTGSASANTELSNSNKDVKKKGRKRKKKGSGALAVKSEIKPDTFTSNSGVVHGKDIEATNVLCSQESDSKEEDLSEKNLEIPQLCQEETNDAESHFLLNEIQPCVETNSLIEDNEKTEECALCLPNQEIFESATFSSDKVDSLTLPNHGPFSYTSTVDTEAMACTLEEAYKETESECLTAIISYDCTCTSSSGDKGHNLEVNCTTDMVCEELEIPKQEKLSSNLGGDFAENVEPSKRNDGKTDPNLHDKDILTKHDDILHFQAERAQDKDTDNNERELNVVNEVIEHLEQGEQIGPLHVDERESMPALTVSSSNELSAIRADAEAQYTDITESEILINETEKDTLAVNCEKNLLTEGNEREDLIYQLEDDQYSEKRSDKLSANLYQMANPNTEAVILDQGQPNEIMETVEHISSSGISLTKDFSPSVDNTVETIDDRNVVFSDKTALVESKDGECHKEGGYHSSNVLEDTPDTTTSVSVQRVELTDDVSEESLGVEEAESHVQKDENQVFYNGVAMDGDTIDQVLSEIQGENSVLSELNHCLEVKKECVQMSDYAEVILPHDILKSTVGLEGSDVSPQLSCGAKYLATTVYRREIPASPDSCPSDSTGTSRSFIGDDEAESPVTNECLKRCLLKWRRTMFRRKWPIGENSACYDGAHSSSFVMPFNNPNSGGQNGNQSGNVLLDSDSFSESYKSKRNTGNYFKTSITTDTDTTQFILRKGVGMLQTDLEKSAEVQLTELPGNLSSDVDTGQTLKARSGSGIGSVVDAPLVIDSSQIKQKSLNPCSADVYVGDISDTTHTAEDETSLELSVKTEERGDFQASEEPMCNSSKAVHHPSIWESKVDDLCDPASKKGSCIIAEASLDNICQLNQEVLGAAVCKLSSQCTTETSIVPSSQVDGCDIDKSDVLLNNDTVRNIEEEDEIVYDIISNRPLDKRVYLSYSNPPQNSVDSPEIHLRVNLASGGRPQSLQTPFIKPLLGMRHFETLGFESKGRSSRVFDGDLRYLETDGTGTVPCHGCTNNEVLAQQIEAILSFVDIMFWTFIMVLIIVYEIA